MKHQLHILFIVIIWLSSTCLISNFSLFHWWGTPLSLEAKPFIHTLWITCVMSGFSLIYIVKPYTCFEFYSFISESPQWLFQILIQFITSLFLLRWVFFSLKTTLFLDFRSALNLYLVSTCFSFYQKRVWLCYNFHCREILLTNICWKSLFLPACVK